MTPARLLRLAIDPALSLLPTEMTSDEARAMLLSIALQESGIQHRRQVGGPARGFWQFEEGGGTLGVLQHEDAFAEATHVLVELAYPVRLGAAFEALEHNDILAAAFARLLLWTLPDPLPGPADPSEGWRQYIEAWRPGRPHRHTWNGHWRTAWDVVDAYPNAHTAGDMG